MNAEKESQIATSVLAAAIITAHPDMSVTAAVSVARDALRGGGTVATAAQIKASIRGDKIQCLEDGTWHTMLRRYIARKYNMTPEEYRAKWGLPDDYPFVAPDYARRRSDIARDTGLGRK